MFELRVYKNSHKAGIKEKCEPDNRKARYFEIHYPSKNYGTCRLEFDNLHTAERVQSAMEHAFIMGRDNKQEEIKRVLGVA